MALGFVDSDAHLDAVGANEGAPNVACLGDGAGGFTCTDISADANDTHGVALGDVDADGHLDAVFANLVEPKRVCLGGPTGFTCSNTSADTDSSWGVQLVDVGGHGDRDHPDGLRVDDGCNLSRDRQPR